MSSDAQPPAPTAAFSDAAAPAKNYSTDPTLYLYTSLTAGSSHIITATSRMETILKANRIPFSGLDLATDEKARMLWGRRAGKDAQGRQRKLPALVQEGLVVGDLVEVEDWNEYGELKQHVKIVGTHNLVAPAKPYSKPNQGPKPGDASAAALAQASQKSKANTPAPAMRGEMKNAPSPVNEPQAGIANAMRGMALEASQKAKDLKKAASNVAAGASKGVADAVDTATKQATDADLENAYKNVEEEKERVREKGYKEEAPLINDEIDTVLTGAGNGAENAKKAAVEEARMADKENKGKDVGEEKEKRERFGYVEPSTTLKKDAEELVAKAEETVLGGGAAEEGAKDLAVRQAEDADKENAHKNIDDEKAEIKACGYKEEGTQPSSDIPAMLPSRFEEEKKESLQSPASTAWKPTEYDAPITTHRGSEVRVVSLEEIRRMEEEERIEEGIEESDSEDSAEKKTQKVIEKVVDEDENVKPKRMTEME